MSLTLGKLIKQERMKLKLTQLELATRVGLSSQFLSNIEREVCGVPMDYMKLFLTELKLSRHKVVDCMVNKFRENLEEHLKSSKQKQR